MVGLRKSPFSKSPFTAATQTRVGNYIQRRGLLEPGDHVLVAVSGGADSTALLLILHAIADSLGFQLSAAHYNHRLRERIETAADEAYVSSLCSSLGVALIRGAGNVASRARRRKESLEEAARNARCAFLGDVSKRYRATAVAVGHTQDDRAETVLLNIIRGAGMEGLGAMQPRAPWPFGRGPWIVRPILVLSQADTGRYCKEAGITPREDPTNAGLVATRNRVRHELLPALRRFNPRINEALVRLSEAAARDADALALSAGVEWDRLATINEGVIFPRRGFVEVHPAIQVRLLQLASAALGSEAASAQQLTAVLDGLARRRSKANLPGAILVTISPSDIKVERSMTFGA